MRDIKDIFIVFFFLQLLKMYNQKVDMKNFRFIVK